MQRTVRYDSEVVPRWEAVRVELGRLGLAATLKMIDGLPAFPDEVPEAGWKDLRVGLPHGMVTLRFDRGSLTCVVWGNADDALRSDWDALCWACAAAGGGRVEAAGGSLAADEFARHAGLRPA